MKLNLAILGLFCGCLHATAQQKFIEVTVADTVQAKADLFVYRILLNSQEDLSEYTMPHKSRGSFEDLTEVRLTKARRTIDSIKAVLKAEGFVLYQSSLGDSINIYERTIPFFMVRIVTHSADSLGLLYRQLRDQKGFMGRLELEVAAHDSTYEKRLFRKILERARAKAETIAGYSGLHVREVLAVTENKTTEGGTVGWTSYPASELAEAVVPGWHTTISSPGSFDMAEPSAGISWYPMAGSFTVRFAVE